MVEYAASSHRKVVLTIKEPTMSVPTAAFRGTEVLIRPKTNTAYMHILSYWLTYTRSQLKSSIMTEDVRTTPTLPSKANSATSWATTNSKGHG